MTRRAPGAELPAALVTGGGTGIGRAVALQLADEGYRVLVTGRRPGPLRTLASQREEITSSAADVGSPEAPAALLDAVRDRLGRLDLLVNNAGRFSAAGLPEVDEEMLAGLFRVNVFGPFRLFRAFLPLLEASRGSVVNVSSTLAIKAAPGSGLYGASKAALEHLTRSWALEAAPLGVRVNAVAPGPTDTDILTRSGLEEEEAEAIRRAERRAIPLGRRGTPDEVARWVIHLATNDKAWITGQVIRVDGGLSAT